MVPVSEKSRGMAGLRHNLDHEDSSEVFSRMYICSVALSHWLHCIRHTLRLADSGPHQTCVYRKSCICPGTDSRTAAVLLSRS